MKPIVAIRRAHDLLSKRTWCQKSYARNAKGRHVDSQDEEAVSFCLFGALYRVTGTDHYVVEQCGDLIMQHPALAKYKRLDSVDLVKFNDAKGRTVREVKKVLADTLVMLRKQSHNGARTRRRAMARAAKLNG